MYFLNMVSGFYMGPSKTLNSPYAKLYWPYFRTGVFPDNFVKLIVEEDKRDRKPSRYKPFDFILKWWF